MKSLKVIIIFICISCFGFQSISAQSEAKTQEKVYKVAMSNVPSAVKDVLKDYSGYKISKEVTFKKKSGESTIYTFKATKGNWTNYLLINEKGKIVEVKSGEGQKK